MRFNWKMPLLTTITATVEAATRTGLAFVYNCANQPSKDALTTAKSPNGTFSHPISSVILSTLAISRHPLPISLQY
jgi:hypothetical protein